MAENESFYRKVASGITGSFNRGRELLSFRKKEIEVIKPVKRTKSVRIEEQLGEKLHELATRIQAEERIPFKEIAEGAGVKSDMLEYHARKHGVTSIFSGGLTVLWHLQEGKDRLMAGIRAARNDPQRSALWKERLYTKARNQNVAAAMRKVWDGNEKRRQEQSRRMKEIAQKKRLSQEEFERRKQIREEAIKTGSYEFLPESERRIIDAWYDRQYGEMPTVAQVSTELHVPPTTAKRYHDKALQHLEESVQSQTVDKAE